MSKLVTSTLKCDYISQTQGGALIANGMAMVTAHVLMTLYVPPVDRRAMSMVLMFVIKSRNVTTAIQSHMMRHQEIVPCTSWKNLFWRKKSEPMSTLK